MQKQVIYGDSSDNHFSEKAQWPLLEVLPSKRDQGPSQLITNFHKSVSHNCSMHLIVCPSNLSLYLEQLIKDNPWSSVYVSLHPPGPPPSLSRAS